MPYKKAPGVTCLTIGVIPNELHKELSDEAKRINLSLASYVRLLLTKRPKAVDLFRN